MPTAFISNAVVSLILCVALREAVPLPRLGWWLCAAYAWVLGRFLLWRAFKRADPPASDIAVWGAYGLAGSALNGIMTERRSDSAFPAGTRKTDGRTCISATGLLTP